MVSSLPSKECLEIRGNPDPAFSSRGSGAVWGWGFLPQSFRPWWARSPLFCPMLSAGPVSVLFVCCSLPVSPPRAFCDWVAPHGAVLPCGLCFPPPWCCILGCGLPSVLTILIGWRLTGGGFYFPHLWRSCVLGLEELHQGPGCSLVSSGHCRPPSSRCLSEAVCLSVAVSPL